ncbi:uncharacterized protein LOC102805806 [Saccoglossus kowalevskii]|uniref:Phosphatidylinositol-glycan biosynthesis class X protein n=1 Tax=Saccoglossus kowalevskii TaxID=10224 RepID=A0ABM0MDQ9_SACKO|nr:PREDICTED: phosphatidylinositol-glycan biosynthesis class X protein-like [Saccoglossus kowalevskii]
MPSYLSSNHSILVYSAFQPTIDGTLYSKTTVPIHQRYQAISDRPDIYYVTAILPKPHFYLYCADSEDVNFMNCESTPFLAPCTALNITQCYWQSLQTTDIDELTFHVPIGQQKDLIMVTIVTIVVTIMGCLVLLVTMVKSDLDRKSHKN